MKHFSRIWDGVVAEVGAGEGGGGSNPQDASSPGHCHLTQAGLSHVPPPSLHSLHPGCQATSTLPPATFPAGPYSTNPADTETCPPAGPTASPCHGQTRHSTTALRHTGAPEP